MDALAFMFYVGGISPAYGYFRRRGDGQFSAFTSALIWPADIGGCLVRIMFERHITGKAK